MAKKKQQKKQTKTPEETKIETKAPESVKTESLENDSDIVNEVASTNTSQLSRRQKKNIKQQGKKQMQSEGVPQVTAIQESSPKKAELPQEDAPTEKQEEDKDEASWKNVEHSKKIKHTDVNRVQAEAHPYKQQKKAPMKSPTKDNKSGFEYHTSEPVKRSSDKKRDFGKTRQEDNEGKGDFDYFTNAPVSASASSAARTNEKRQKETKPKPDENEGFKNVTKEQTDKDFDKFKILYKEKTFKEGGFVKVKEIQQDLFDMPTTYALAHCVAEDMKMGSGIAVQFSQKFKRRDELYQQRQRQGGLAILEDGDRYIYYLVTKKLSNGKPTNQTMWNSLQKLEQHMRKHNVKKLAIPRIGCGLDRLEWSEVKAMVEYTFRNIDVEIVVCNFQQPEDDAPRGANPPPPTKQMKCPVRNVRYPIVDIEQGTAIIYFGTANGHISEDIQSLDAKFRIVGDYIRATKKLGEVVQVYKNNQEFSLLGCITRLTEKDPFDFVSFQKCIVQIKKLNKSYYNYVAIQAFLDDHDELLLDKITTMLRYSLIKVEVYVCWGGKMANFMPQERQDYH